MPNVKCKPSYQFIRYDIRPRAGLTNDESDYLAVCVAKLQALEFVREICLAFELPSSQDVPKGIHLHAHIGIVFTRARRTDKVPILDIAKYSKQKNWSRHAVKTVKAEKWSPASFWLMGYIQKDGEWSGHCRDYSTCWYTHSRVMLQEKTRVCQITCSTFGDEVANWWLGNYAKIIRDIKKALPNRQIITAVHVLAHLLCSTRCDYRMVRKTELRAFFMSCTMKYYSECVDLLLTKSDWDPHVVEVDIREKYPVGGLHTWAVPLDLPPGEIEEK